MGRPALGSEEGLLLKSSSSIHTCFMRFAIDAVFLDEDMRVVAIREGLRPWRLAFARRSRAVLELGAGESRRLGIGVGETLSIRVSGA